MHDETTPELRPKPNLSLSLVSAEGHTRRSAASLLVSVAIQSLFIAALIAVPLMATDDLPQPDGASALRFLPPPPAAPLAPRTPPPRGATPPRPMPVTISSFVIPAQIPDTILPPVSSETPFIEHGAENGAPAATSPFVVGGLQRPSPAPAPVAAPSGPVRVGGDVREPRRTIYRAPIYPAIARQARIEGDVTLEAIIGTNGRVERLRILAAHPMLERAALDAVSQWVYDPTLLNGTPVPVVITVKVSFVLAVR